MKDYDTRKPSSERGAKPEHGVDIFNIGTPSEWKDYLLAGRTMVRLEYPDPKNNVDIPYDVDFVWTENIRFTYYGAKVPNRAIYIIRPKYATSWAYDNKIEGSWPMPFIVGVTSKKPGYTVLKMQFATFLD